jgi:hypothetical protein
MQWLLERGLGMTEKPRGEGLSPSSLATFMGCQRKYFYNKVGKVEKDADSQGDVESLQVGSAFHKCLEDTKHLLDGYGLKDVTAVCEAHDITDPDTAALILAMLAKYKVMHARAGLAAIACEVVINTDTFYGIVDVVLQGIDGWWIGDMKTAASFRSDIIPAMPMHPQLNLYAFHADKIADHLNLSPENFKGCRYRLVTKSRISRKASESAGAYIGRLTAAVKAFDFILPKERMQPKEVYGMHQAVTAEIKLRGPNCSPSIYPQNLSNCFSYFRPCEFWSQCHGAQFSDMLDVGLDCVTGD